MARRVSAGCEIGTAAPPASLRFWSAACPPSRAVPARPPASIRIFPRPWPFSSPAFALEEDHADTIGLVCDREPDEPHERYVDHPPPLRRGTVRWTLPGLGDHRALVGGDDGRP